MENKKNQRQTAHKLVYKTLRSLECICESYGLYALPFIETLKSEVSRLEINGDNAELFYLQRMILDYDSTKISEAKSLEDMYQEIERFYQPLVEKVAELSVHFNLPIYKDIQPENAVANYFQFRFKGKGQGIKLSHFRIREDGLH
jgi:hypothetical protein